MKKLIIALILILNSIVLGVPKEDNPGNAGGEGNHYGWDKNKGVAVPELDPGLTLCAIIILISGTFIILAKNKFPNKKEDEIDIPKRIK